MFFIHRNKRWVPLSVLQSIPRPRYTGVDSDPTGWRFDTLRAGWKRWLTGGIPLLPIRIVIWNGVFQVSDGNHRLTTAREIGVPVLIETLPESMEHVLFGWPFLDDAAVLPTLAPRELTSRMNAPSEEAALAFRDQLVACVSRRQQQTSEDFATAARGMFNTEGQGLIAKFDRSETDPLPLLNDLARGLRTFPTTMINLRDFVLGRQPPDEARLAAYEKEVLPVLRDSKQTLRLLINVLQGERR